mmetsp:Transcript_18122/g.50771  ORF Transcript_18122/g.50771 Transcript_18122/m.50771 type:complete len:309 (+) Transcript_18122:268-1194(+)
MATFTMLVSTDKSSRSTSSLRTPSLISRSATSGEMPTLDAQGFASVNAHSRFSASSLPCKRAIIFGNAPARAMASTWLHVPAATLDSAQTASFFSDKRSHLSRHASMADRAPASTMSCIFRLLPLHRLTTVLKEGMVKMLVASSIQATSLLSVASSSGTSDSTSRPCGAPVRYLRAQQACVMASWSLLEAMMRHAIGMVSSSTSSCGLGRHKLDSSHAQWRSTEGCAIWRSMHSRRGNTTSSSSTARCNSVQSAAMLPSAQIACSSTSVSSQFLSMETKIGMAFWSTTAAQSSCSALQMLVRIQATSY